MFDGATNFNQPLDFDTRNVTNMGCMFISATNFNQPLDFDTRNVTRYASGCSLALLVSTNHWILIHET